MSRVWVRGTERGGKSLAPGRAKKGTRGSRSAKDAVETLNFFKKFPERISFKGSRPRPPGEPALRNVLKFASLRLAS